MSSVQLPSDLNVLLLVPDSGIRASIAASLRALAGESLHLIEASAVPDAHAKARVFRFDVVVVCWKKGPDSKALGELRSTYPGECPPIIEMSPGGSSTPQADASVTTLSLELMTSDALTAALASVVRKPANGESANGGIAAAGGFEQVDGALAVIGRKGEFLWISKAAAQMLEKEPPALLGTAAPFLLSSGGSRQTVSLKSGDGGRRIEVRAFPMKWNGEDAHLAAFFDAPTHTPAPVSFDFLDEIVHQTDDSVLVLDLHGNIAYVNRAYERSSGYALADLKGKHLRLLWAQSAENPDFDEMWRRVSGGTAWYGRFRNHRKGGDTIVEEATIFPIRDGDSQIVHYAALMRDVTDRVQIEEALRRSEERYALAARGAHDGLWDWSLETGEFYVAPRWKEMLGYDRVELKPSINEWHDRVHPDDFTHLQGGLTAHLLGDTKHFQCEHRIRHSNGDYRWMLARGIATRDHGGRAVRIAGSMTDITEKKVSEEQLLHQAWHDGLTNLINRATFIDRLRQRLTRARWSNSWNFAVLFVDLDRFKAVNDSLGHLAGDELLVSLADRMKKAVSERDVVGRIGGDEFGVMVDQFHDRNEPIRLAEQLLAVLDRPYEIQGRSFHISASIGISYAEARYQDAEHLLRDADTAMYRSKKRERGSYLVFERPMLDETLKTVEMEIDLHNALEYQQLRVFYQPIISSETGRIAGFEALVRWDHPVLGFVSPNDFIPIAEESGLIIPIDLWVLKTGCGQIREWQERFSAMTPHTFFLSANLSARHFAMGDSLEHIQQALNDTSIAPQCLKLEITESLLLDQTDSALPMLNKLRAMGVQISLDDFGKGYSSLSYLQQLPVSNLKIDKSFVKDMVENERSLGIVRIIVTLSQSLGLPIVAEGVETRAQFERLRDLRCQYLQGFLFSPPVPPATVERMLSEQTAW